MLLRWLRRDDGNALIEAALLLPIMLTMLFGVTDIGTALMIDKKLITAAQVASDLLARHDSVTSSDIANAEEAAKLALMPYDTTPFGIDIAGVKFINASADPTVEWRDTQNMSPNANVVNDTAGLGAENEGVIEVTVQYTYTPYFAGLITGNMPMKEVAIARGRDEGKFISKE